MRLASRLRRVRVCCGDWTRVVTPAVTIGNGITGVFLDPPYASDRAEVYGIDSRTVAYAVKTWAVENGDNPKFRIALCGYEGEHDMPGNWECIAWKANGGYGNQAAADGAQSKTNAHKETIWFSPRCLRPQANLFHGMDELAIPLNNVAGQAKLGARDLIAEEAFVVPEYKRKV